MTTLTNLKKLLVGGVISLTLVAAVACSGGADPTATVDSKVATEPESEQVTAIVNTATVKSEDTATTPEQVEPDARDAVIVAAAEEPETPTPTAESIQAAFEGETEDKIIGDAVTELPEEITPAEAPDVVELTPAEIVEAQGVHLANLYDDVVQSVVFIVARSSQGEGSGSGFVWDTDGHIVTNFHVIQGATSLSVKFFNGREYRAEVIAFDPDSDLAVIKLIDVDHDLVPITIGNSSDLRPGEMAIALGNPFGEEFTMTTGIVSAVSRTINSGFSSYSIPSVVQTDAAINPGNSGGPLLDMNGTVIGVNTQIKSDSRQSSGVGFAVPVDLVRRVVPSLINDGQHIYSLMGISGEEVGIAIRETAGLPGDITGAIVMTITPGGPADNAGIRGDSIERASNGVPLGTPNYDGDIIVSINSKRMKSMDDLIAYLALNTAPGDDIVVGIFRDGVEIAIPMTLGSRPSTT
jgi:2-alkenal reductase